MDTETSTETPLETALRLLPWGTTVYTITRSATPPCISALVVTEDGSIIDLSDTLAAIGFERIPGFAGIHVAGIANAHEELVTQISEAIHDDPAELMHEQL